MKKSAGLFILVMLVYTASVTAAVPTGYGLVWSDEFSGTTVDTNTWTFDTGVGNPPGWGNNELEYYTGGANFKDSAGYGILIAKKENFGGRNYTSCRMNTMGKKAFKYGYFEARIKTPTGNGLWPAFWTLGSDFNTGVPWPSCGEVELYEQRTGSVKHGGTAGDNCFIQTCHYATSYHGTTPSYNSHQTNNSNCLCSDFHTYSILWDSLGFTYYFDGTQTWTYSNINMANNEDSFHQTFFFIANIAIGGAYQGQDGGFVDNSIFPQEMYIDYIRVYQKGVTSTVAGPAERQSVNPFAIVNPSKSQLKIFDLNGRLVADYTSNVRVLKAGDAAMKALPLGLCAGAYIARFYDGATAFTTQKLAASR